MSLSAQQRAAVERRGQDVCVVAGPGSGKTRVLVERFAWLVDQGVSPLRILAITFTEKAAYEIKKRLVERFAARPEVRRQIERAYVSTLHAFCLRLLKENAIAAGLDPRFDLLDERQQTAELHAAAAQALDDLFERRPHELRRLLESWRTERPVEDILAVCEAVRLSGRPIASLRETPFPEGAFDRLVASVRAMRRASPRGTTDAQRRKLAELDEWLSGVPQRPFAAAHFEHLKGFKCDKRWPRDHPIYAAIDGVREQLEEARAELVAAYYSAQRETLIRTLEHFDEIYRAKKRALSRLDFSDLEEQAIALLRANGELRENVRENFEAILMDELQDTNPLQWELMDLVRTPGRFFAVGDINQSIFGFRHAEPRVFERFRQAVSARGVVDRLGENYRSRSEVLAAVDRVCSGLGGIVENQLEPVRRFTRGGAPVEIVAAHSDEWDGAEAAEAAWIAGRIRELQREMQIEDRAGGVRAARFRDFAVLVRNTGFIDALEPELAKRHVPYLLTRGRSFFEEPEVTDLVAALRAIENPLDEAALAAAARSPLFGIRDEALLRFKLDGKDPEEFGELRRLLNDVRRWKDELPPDRLLARLLDACGYEEGARPGERANIDKLLALLRDWHAARPAPLSEWLELLANLRQEHEEPNAPANDSPDAVHVMSIHASKGLEYPVVFLAALHKGVETRKASLLYRPERGLGVRWRDPMKDAGISDAVHIANGQEVAEKEEQEADRLLYVAMTRAEERLVLSFSYSDASRPLPPWPQRVLDAFGVTLTEITVTEPARAPEEGAAEAAPAGEPEALRRPSVTLYDATASVTAVAQFVECPRRYYLERYLGMAPVQAHFDEDEDVPKDHAAGELSASELGTMVHEMLAGTFAGEATAEARDLAAGFALSELGRRAAAARRAEREWDFLYALEGIVLRGQIDLWFEEEGGRTVLVDYKTDRDESRLEHYTLQLRLYGAAVERMTGKAPDEMWIFFLRSGRAVAVTAGEEAERVAEFREAQDRQEFPLQTGTHCRPCPFYRNACPAGL
ncbi:MAG: UvrD-helicase domain-containing protein [Bryobacteraceae bacterium]|nr:UvrD-helicase domain-containing protein [Bryobacteraceae bacterium]